MFIEVGDLVNDLKLENSMYYVNKPEKTHNTKLLYPWDQYLSGINCDHVLPENDSERSFEA